MFSEWNFRVPPSFDVSLGGLVESAGEVPVTQERCSPTLLEDNASSLSHSNNILHFHAPPLVRNDAGKYFRRANTVDRFHVRTREPLLFSNGPVYMECQLLRVGPEKEKGGDTLDYVPVPLVLGICKEDLPPFRLPGQDNNSIGYFTSQRLVYSHGEEEGHRLPMALHTAPPLTAEGTLREDSGGTSGIPRRGLEPGDCVGCIVNPLIHTVQYTLNGFLLPFRGNTRRYSSRQELYFAIGVQRRTPSLSVRMHMVAGVVADLKPPIALAFDLDAYNKAFSTAVVYREMEKVMDHNWRETQERHQTAVTLLRRYLTQRGMASTLSALRQELDELRPGEMDPDTDASTSFAEESALHARRMSELRRATSGMKAPQDGLQVLSTMPLLTPEVCYAVNRLLGVDRSDALSSIVKERTWSLEWISRRQDVLYVLKGAVLLSHWMKRLDTTLDSTLDPRDAVSLPVEALEEFRSEVLQLSFALKQMTAEKEEEEEEETAFLEEWLKRSSSKRPSEEERQAEEEEEEEEEDTFPLTEETVRAAVKALLARTTPHRPSPSLRTQLVLGEALSLLVRAVCSTKEDRTLVQTVLQQASTECYTRAWRVVEAAVVEWNDRTLQVFLEHSSEKEGDELLLPPSLLRSCVQPLGGGGEAETIPLSLRDVWRRTYAKAALLPSLHTINRLFKTQLEQSVKCFLPAEDHSGEPGEGRNGAFTESERDSEGVRNIKEHLTTIFNCAFPL